MGVDLPLALLLVLLSGLIGWVLGAASARRAKRAGARMHSSERTSAYSATIEGGPSTQVHVSQENVTETPPIANRLADSTNEIDTLIASVRSDEIRISSRKRRGGQIKHLLVTRNGERWVVDRLPKDDYADFDEAPPSVDQLISKPAGYRLVRGYNLLKPDDRDEGES